MHDSVPVRVTFTCECTLNMFDGRPYHETLEEAIRMATQDITCVKIKNVHAEFVEEDK